MKNKIITSEGNIQFIDSEGKVINISPSQVYSMINEDTVSFLLVHLPKSSGLSLFTTKVEDLELNGATYSQSTIADALAEAFSEAGAVGRFEVVDELPTEGKTNTIYLLPKDEGEGYDEYIYIKDESKWELIGDTSVEIKNYLKKSDFNEYSAATKTAIDSKQDTLIAGENITISGNVISATGGDLSNYYTKSETSGATEISTALASKADKSEIPSLDGYATETWVEGKGYLTEHQDISGKLDVSAFNTYSGSVDTQLNSKASESDLNALNDTVTAHTANTTVHVTEADKTAWNAKSDFSGDYNDLTNKPTSNTAFTNDAGYITSSALDGYATTGDVQTATNDMATKTWVGQQGYLTEHQSLSNYYKKSETSGATEIQTALENKQDTLASGINIKTINNESILGSGNIEIQGGGKAIEAGRGISITTGETADTVSFNLPISAGTGTDALVIASDTFQINNKAIGDYSVSLNGGGLHPNYAYGTSSLAQGFDTRAYGNGCHSEGYASKAGVQNNIYIQFAHAEGDHTEAKGNVSHTEGRYTIANNKYEHSSGQYNISSSASATFGDSGNTLFSVGNGTADNARHNAFEIRQNGDIYLTKDGQDVKLQDQLGGSSITVDTALDSGSTNPVENRVIYNKIDEVEQVTAAGLNAVNDKFDGLKLMKISQTDYENLQVKDQNTLYIVI